MEVMASYYTDAGNVKTTNQDSLSVKIVNSPNGRIVFAVVCDGMGGLQQGELASKEVVLAFEQWFQADFARMVASSSVTENQIYSEWRTCIDLVNQRLIDYGIKSGAQLGTTLTTLLVYQGNYYICHVGDSRIYKVTKKLEIMTQDHTVVAHEMRMGIITAEQAKDDPRNNILLQCVGASADVEPQLMSGIVTEATTFILCSDGFVHKLSESEIYEQFKPDILHDKEDVANACQSLSKLAMDRGERDNITAVGIVLKDEE